MKLKEIESNIQRDLNVGWRIAKAYRQKLFNVWGGYKEAIEDMSVRFDDDGRLEFTLSINHKQKILKI